MQECIEYLQRNFGATIQEGTVREESVHFPLPKSLRDLLPRGTAQQTVTATAVLNSAIRDTDSAEIDGCLDAFD